MQIEWKIVSIAIDHIEEILKLSLSHDLLITHYNTVIYHSKISLHNYESMIEIVTTEQFPVRHECNMSKMEYNGNYLAIATVTGKVHTQCTLRLEWGQAREWTVPLLENNDEEKLNLCLKSSLTSLKRRQLARRERRNPRLRLSYLYILDGIASFLY